MDDFVGAIGLLVIISLGMWSFGKTLKDAIASRLFRTDNLANGCSFLAHITLAGQPKQNIEQAIGVVPEFCEWLVGHYPSLAIRWEQLYNPTLLTKRQATDVFLKLYAIERQLRPQAEIGDPLANLFTKRPQTTSPELLLCNALWIVIARVVWWRMSQSDRQKHWADPNGHWWKLLQQLKATSGDAEAFFMPPPASVLAPKTREPSACSPSPQTP